MPTVCKEIISFENLKTTDEEGLEDGKNKGGQNKGECHIDLFCKHGGNGEYFQMRTVVIPLEMGAKSFVFNDNAFKLVTFSMHIGVCRWNALPRRLDEKLRHAKG